MVVTDDAVPVLATGGGSVRSALKTLSRLPVWVLPASDETRSPLSRTLAQAWAAVSAGLCASSSESAPETCGVAIDVPLMNPKAAGWAPLPGTVE